MIGRFSFFDRNPWKQAFQKVANTKRNVECNKPIPLELLCVEAIECEAILKNFLFLTKNLKGNIGLEIHYCPLWRMQCSHWNFANMSDVYPPQTRTQYYTAVL